MVFLVFVSAMQTHVCAVSLLMIRGFAQNVVLIPVETNKVIYNMKEEKTMKLNKVINRKVGDQTYHKFIITVPLEHVKELGWSEKTELKMKNDGKKLVIERE